jgi:hypothetical protein
LIFFLDTETVGKAPCPINGCVLQLTLPFTFIFFRNLIYF